MPQKPSSPPPALTADELDRMVCSCGGGACQNHQLYFHGRCHPKAGVEVAYSKGSQKLTVRCNTCKKFIAEVAVAGAPKPSEIYTAIENEDRN